MKDRIFIIHNLMLSFNGGIMFVGCEYYYTDIGVSSCSLILSEDELLKYNYVLNACGVDVRDRESMNRFMLDVDYVVPHESRVKSIVTDLLNYSNVSPIKY